VLLTGGKPAVLRRGLLLTALAAAVTGSLLAWPAQAPGAPTAAWCGTVSAEDRPAHVGGRPIRVLYAITSDGPDNSAAVAPRISADVDEIEQWWRGQDSARVPRFDRAVFPCGEQADIRLLRLRESSGELVTASGETVFDSVADQVEAIAPAGAPRGAAKYLVYIDIRFQAEDTCGIGGGFFRGSGLATIFLTNCTGDISSTTVATHELLHSFGALPRSGPPHACPESAAHPCDHSGDILYLWAQPAPLSSFALDVGRDDYYGHTGAWGDVQDSEFLRRLDQEVTLEVKLAGSGSVRSDLPGVDCSSSCTSTWNRNERVLLTATPAAGHRFARWIGGGCAGTGVCEPSLQASASVTAQFGPPTFPLRLAVRGQGQIVVAPGAFSCGGTCAREVTSVRPVTLKAVPAKGWRLDGWRRGCSGWAATCRLPKTATASATAVFVRR
jgi:hypothetical protein